MKIEPEISAAAGCTPGQPPRIFRLAVSGLGAIGASFLALVIHNTDYLKTRHGVELRLVGAVDSSGAVTNPDGIDIRDRLSVKRPGRRPPILGPDCVRFAQPETTGWQSYWPTNPRWFWRATTS